MAINSDIVMNKVKEVFYPVSKKIWSHMFMSMKFRVFRARAAV